MFFFSALLGGSVDHILDFKGASTLAELCILLLMPCVVQFLVADVGLFSILGGLQLVYKDAYLDYHQFREID